MKAYIDFSCWVIEGKDPKEIGEKAEKFMREGKCPEISGIDPSVSEGESPNMECFEHAPKLKTIEEIREHCRNLYYCDDADTPGGDSLWEPFENYDKVEIANFIENDTLSLCAFLGVMYK